MTPAAIAAAVLTYGPSVLPLLQQLAAWIASGKKEVSAADIEQLIAYGKKTSGDYLRDVGLSTPPPV